jgi:DNA-binding NtrC family response regulator
LVQQQWTGNLRQLENAIIHGVVSARGQPIMAEHLPHMTFSRDAPNDRPLESRNFEVDSSEALFPLPSLLARVERMAIRRALELSSGNQSRAAKILGINRTTLVEKIRKFK